MPTGIARWVAYELPPAETLGETKRKSSFKRDERVFGSPVHKDYTHSGFDRGHLKPAADSKSSSECMAASFLMTNVAPQTPQLNRGSWKQLEEATRDWAHELGEVYVVCGAWAGITRPAGQRQRRGALHLLESHPAHRTRHGLHRLHDAESRNQAGFPSFRLGSHHWTSSRNSNVEQRIESHRPFEVERPIGIDDSSPDRRIDLAHQGIHHCAARRVTIERSPSPFSMARTSSPKGKDSPMMGCLAKDTWAFFGGRLIVSYASRTDDGDQGEGWMISVDFFDP